MFTLNYQIALINSLLLIAFITVFETRKDIIRYIDRSIVVILTFNYTIYAHSFPIPSIHFPAVSLVFLINVNFTKYLQILSSSISQDTQI